MTEKRRLDTGATGDVFIGPVRKYRNYTEYCGKVVICVKTDGKFYRVTWKCKSRECELCKKERANKIKRQVNEALDIGMTYKVILDKEQSARLSRSLGSDNYIRLPQEDGTFIVILNTYDDKLVNKYGLERILTTNDIDWGTISNTPEGKRMTGKLGKYIADDEPVGREITCDIIHVYSDADENSMDQAMEQAVKETSDTIPETDNEYELAMNRRVNRYAAALKEMGFEINKMVKKVKMTVCEEWLIWRDDLQINDITFKPVI